MKASEVMTRDVRTIAPDRSIQDAASLMAEQDVGAIPVEEGDQLIGMITDRDIAVRAVGEGKGPATPVREAMSREVKYCYEDEDLSDVVRNMGDIQVRRLPVMSRAKKLVGIVSLADIAEGQGNKQLLGEALSGVTREGGQHNQAGH